MIKGLRRVALAATLWGCLAYFPGFSAAANRAPQISGSPATTIAAGSQYSFSPSAKDPDSGQTLKFSVRNKPSWANFSTSTGRLHGKPEAKDAGKSGSIVISVTDGTATTSLKAFVITVSAPANRAPKISGSPATKVKVGSSYSFSPTGSDADGNKLTYSITNKPSWASFSTSTGKLSGKPAATHVGTTSGIVIKVSDGKASAALAAFSLKVEAAGNSAPKVSGTPSTTASVGVAYRFSPTAVDPDGDAITWSISGKPSGASFSVSTGQLAWTPTATGNSSSIVIKATDAKGKATSLPGFVIKVGSAQAKASASTGTASLSWDAPTEYTDGRRMSDLEVVAYRIYRGATASSLARVAEVDARSLSFVIRDLAAGTHHFAVTAVSGQGLESALSVVVSKVVR